MTTFTQAQGTRTEVLDLGTLASATFIASSAIDLGAAIPLDVSIDVECDPNGAPSGNAQLRVFVQLSLNGTDFTTGPVSSTSVVNIQDLYAIGTVPCNDTNAHRKIFSLSGLPIARYIKVVVLNDTGVALTSGKVYTAAITGVGT